MYLWFFCPQKTNAHFVLCLSVNWIKTINAQSERLIAATLQLITHHLTNRQIIHSFNFQFNQTIFDIIDDLILLMIAVEQDRLNIQTDFIHTRYQKWFNRQLTEVECRRHQCRIPRSALLCPPQSQWRQVLPSRDDQALITLTRLDFVTFDMVVYPFKFFFNNYTPFTKDGTIVALRNNNLGRPRLISAADGLGLILA